MRKLFVLLLLSLPIWGITQNVGVGTTTPSAKLEVKNPLMSVLKVSSNNFSDTSRFIWSNRNNFNQGLDFIFSSVREEGLLLSTTSDIPGQVRDSILSVTSSGNVGIGVKFPYHRLVLHDASSSVSFISMTNSVTGYGNENGLMLGMSSNNASFLNQENGSVFIGTNDATQLTISPVGNVGIGVIPAAAQKLDVAGNIRGTGDLTITNIAASGNITAGNQISATGSIITDAEFQRTSTGTTNLVPIAWGYVSATGFVSASTSSGNFTCSHTITGFYQINITGETYQFQQYSTVATAIGTTAPRIVCTGSGGGLLQIAIYDITGADVDENFSFVVYKK